MSLHSAVNLLGPPGNAIDDVLPECNLFSRSETLCAPAAPTPSRAPVGHVSITSRSGVNSIRTKSVGRLPCGLLLLPLLHALLSCFARIARLQTGDGEEGTTRFSESLTALVNATNKYVGRSVCLCARVPLTAAAFVRCGFDVAEPRS